MSPSGGAIGLRSDIRIAVVGPFSGPRSAWGDLLLHAIRRYRLPGFVWEPVDDVGDADVARRVAARIAADGGYRAVIGHFNSLGVAAALPIYRAAGIPLLLPLSTGTGLLSDGRGGALRWCAEDRGQLLALTAEAHRMGAPRLWVTDDGSANGSHLSAELLGLTGGAVPVSTTTDPADCAGPVVVCGTHHGAAKTGLSLRAAGYAGRLLFPDDCGVPEFAELLGDDPDAHVVRLTGGAVACVEEAFAALTGALIADPHRAGPGLLDLVCVHSGVPLTETGEPAPGARGWELVGVDALRGAHELAGAPANGTPELDTLVVGTGIVGCATAAALAEPGRRVALIGLGPDASSATRNSGGLIRAYEPDEAVRELTIRSFRLLWQRPESGPFGFRRTGSLVLLGPGDLAEAERGVAHLRDGGVAAHLIDAAEIRRRWPDFAVDDVAAAVWEPGGGYTTTIATANAFRADAVRRGVLAWYGRVHGVRPGPAGVVAETGWGAVDARTVVVATGSSIPDLRDRAGAAIGPQARVKRIRYGWFDRGGRVLPTVSDLVTGMWGRPNLDGDSFLTGRPVDEWDVPASGGDALTTEQVDYIRSGAATRWPWLASADYLGGRFGADLYGDGGPLHGAVCADLPVVAAGVFSGGGVKAAPATAARVAATIRGMLT
ncbi:FAD-dependent oxidoreductase [Actinophytocola algeriensis]|uniref:Glycine/D-amino acid oxidase-like deaminating enzyme n=1 Tax=Actinophytocola algeriensis TaxID=1768010 RepID=A0A7W7VCI9_9PSEU|nr:FAD-dependent oxidoreductase [Actinophytocola algeriensis]MBB4905112.1 glycine/D-amino acid oxidase-like deaminating enzyme [Actinophytocola algeriensis]MBE1473203.1 glycine/D-amino acid oxidase-like deaminating enzyme [Actinophytocola algeriensis]